MPYQGELASKLGHLTLIESPWVRDLVAGFERAPTPAGDLSGTPWQKFDPSGAAPLSRVWAVDGSIVPVQSTDTPPREVAFVKSVLVLLDQEQIAEIDPCFPHPLDLRDALAESGLFHATAFPLRHVRTCLGSNYTAVRNIIHDSIHATWTVFNTGGTDSRVPPARKKHRSPSPHRWPRKDRGIRRSPC